MESGTPFPDTSRASSIARFAAIGVVVAGIASLFAYAGGWLTPHRLTPNAMINTFEAVNGSHPGFRRNHAKGVCVSGYFESKCDRYRLHNTAPRAHPAGISIPPTPWRPIRLRKPLACSHPSSRSFIRRHVTLPAEAPMRPRDSGFSRGVGTILGMKAAPSRHCRGNVRRGLTVAKTRTTLRAEVSAPAIARLQWPPQCHPRG
jgi:hypothetical protein